MGLKGSPAQLAQLLQERVVRPHLEALVDDFYSHLLDSPEARPFLTVEAVVERLRRSQIHYLQNLGVEFCGEDYFEERLRVGLVHARVGLPLPVYLMAYQRLKELLLDRVAEAGLSPAERAPLERLILRISALDAALAVQTYHVVQVRDLENIVETLKSQDQALRERLRTDSLTGLFARDHVTRALSRLISRPGKAREVAVAMADLDHFKAINDTYGHPVGDRILQQVATRLAAAVRAGDVVGRYGGEEFILVLPESSEEGARQVAERVRRRVEEAPFVVGDTRLKLTISVGLTLGDAGGDNVDAMIDRADGALYLAKEAGRNRVSFVEAVPPH